MGKISGTTGRAISGGIVGSAILAGASVVEGNDPRIGIYIGAIFGLMIGIIVGLLVFTRLFRGPIPYFIIGGVVGAVLIAVITNLEIDIELGSVVSPNTIGLLSGGFIGGVIAVIISRGIPTG